MVGYLDDVMFKLLLASQCLTRQFGLNGLRAEESENGRLFALLVVWSSVRFWLCYGRHSGAMWNWRAGRRSWIMSALRDMAIYPGLGWCSSNKIDYDSRSTIV